MGTRSRFVTTALLVLIALGGAGLAVAADRRQTPNQRPEITRSADHAAQPYLGNLARDLSRLSNNASDLAKSGRDLLGNLQSLNLDATRAALSAGDDSSSAINGALSGLNADRAAAASGIDRSRLGPDTAAELD